MKRLLITLLIWLSLASPVWAYDFDPVKQLLQRQAAQDAMQRPQLTLLFETIGKTEMQKGYNLWEVKKDFAETLATAFLVANPVVAEQIKQKQKVNHQMLRQDRAKLREYLAANKADRLVLVTQSLEGTNLKSEVEVLDENGQVTLSMIQFNELDGDVVGEPKIQQMITMQETKTTPPREQTAQFTEDFASGFAAKYLNPDHNNAWVDLNPTAYSVPKTTAVEGVIFIKNLLDVDIRGSRFRWDWKAAQPMLLGLEMNGTKAGALHSSYAFLKFPFFEENNLALAAGLKGRLYWNPNNLDFQQDPATDDRNDRRNRLAIFFASSYKIPDFGILANAYVDNQRLGFGGKYNMTDNFKLFADAYINHYQNPLNAGDFSAGMQFYHPAGTVFTGKYQFVNQQALIGIGYGF